ncbi:hypothetical protein E2C01_015378 [Portunus trituberculatus]|uniref:Uncharacterized protein n=1 Tax=Portunus trituberculatus TaxID=210409 RepID=A0A5B7DMV3_PORTR|nr:hypothetical protein [Portunus trituberculatus]
MPWSGRQTLPADGERYVLEERFPLELAEDTGCLMRRRCAVSLIIASSTVLIRPRIYTHHDFVREAPEPLGPRRLRCTTTNLFDIAAVPVHFRP